MHTDGHKNVIRHAFYYLRDWNPSFREILFEANHFTDDYLNTPKNYYPYNNYYNKSKKNRNEISLKRVEFQSKNTAKRDMAKCDREISKKFNQKDFFAFINGLPCNPYKIEPFDTCNQSDNVAFLHAMRDKAESIESATKKFEEHLKTCFYEYLFREDFNESLFILGIALHGITDSFTPSHCQFQSFAKQNEAYVGLSPLGNIMGSWHAPGDMVPFRHDGELYVQEPPQKWWYKFDPNGKIDSRLYIFSDTAIKTFQEIFDHLANVRYSIETNRGNGENAVDEAVGIWKNSYNNFIQRINNFGVAETGHAFKKLIDPKTYTTAEGYYFTTG
jgi:hypothetical protein